VNRTNHSVTGAGGDASRQLQWPLIGIVVLLVVLILLTPNLFSTSAGGLQTRAQLVVDRAPTGDVTNFYVESIGTSVRYQSIAVGLVGLPSWPFTGAVSKLTAWNWTNGTETLVLVVSNTTNPLAVNVTVKYVDPSGFTAEYVGVYGFYLNAATRMLEAITLLPGASAPPTATPLTDLPIFLLLSIRTPTGLS